LAYGFQYRTSTLVSNIEPALSPARQTSRELLFKILFVHALPKLEASSSDFYNILFTGLRLKVEKVVEEVEIRLYAKECFAKVDKNSYVQNGIEVKLVKLDAIIEEKTTEEIGNREA
jgi:hypothetical protein